MLEVTPQAAAAIHEMVDTPELPDGSGVRLSSNGDESRTVSVAPAPMPEAGDQVVENEGARVFLERSLVTLLDKRVLDARVDEAGKVMFQLALQSPLG